MATAYKILGQQQSVALTDVDAYTVPSATQSVVSTIVITNRSATAGTYNLAVRASGATIDPKHYLAYGAPIAGNDATILTIGITLSATDVVTFQASSDDMSINIFGSEIS